jgi:molybdopterin/thiamine biosynthesis adenylyltransferase
MKIITVVGVGALGSHTVQFLRNAKATLKVIDFDRVESKNIQGQFHGKHAVGQAKVMSLRGAMDLLFGVKIQTNLNKLGDHNVDALLGGSDLVIDCLDNAASRRVIQTFVRKTQIPCLHAAVDANGSFGRVCWDESFRIDEEDGEGAPTCENGEHLPFLAMVAAHVAHSAKEFMGKGSRLGYRVSPGGTIRV